MRRVILIPALLGIVAASLVACSSGERTVTVNHQATPTPVYLDLGDPGPSAGDMRTFSFSAPGPNNQTVQMDAVMITTGIVAGSTDEYRDMRITFTFGSAADQLILQGVAVYPGEGSVLKPATTVSRSIIGGSGAYAGATGWCDSTHNADGTWTHVFHLR